MKNNKPEASVKARMTGASGLCRQYTLLPGVDIACLQLKSAGRAHLDSGDARPALIYVVSKVKA
ncbi:hypothetical protein [Paenibacillus xylanexedens]|uniref:hypothetical protein n=1 Tax=Paenibacillus xylanexedens TaxID=528191 RepID=UPI0011A77C61|nr:hypothetical protein [Paenibacillus xylanexedens]